MVFRRNVGKIDRFLRFGIGTLFIYLGMIDGALVSDQLARGLLVGMGGMLVAIAFIAWCPLYFLIGYSTLGDKA